MSQLSKKAELLQERKWELQRRMVSLLKIVSAEFESDPMSTQCFDERIVKEISQTVKEHEQIKDLTPF